MRPAGRLFTGTVELWKSAALACAALALLALPARPQGQSISWNDLQSGKIKQANFEGRDVRERVAPYGLASSLNPCAGDCHEDDSVTVDEILTMVNIALGDAPVDFCLAGDVNDDGNITVDEILTAVSNALGGCVIVPVSGTWREDQYRLRSSDCDGSLTDAIMSVVGQPPVCDYQLSQNGADVTAQDCAGNTATGMVDATGTLRFDLAPEQETEDGCTISISPSESIPVSHSPTVATFTLPITLSGTCGGFSSCTIVVEATWTKL